MSLTTAPGTQTGEMQYWDGSAWVTVTPGNTGEVLTLLNPDFPDDWRSPQKDMLWQGVNGVNNPCPTGYRLPTEAE